MWICFNNAFISVVAHRTDPALLLVRARLPGHIEAVFPQAKTFEATGRADYNFRAYVPRTEVASAIANTLAAVQYENFKDSVKDDELHDAYMGFWNIMYRVQQKFLMARNTVTRHRSGKPVSKPKHKLSA